MAMKISVEWEDHIGDPYPLPTEPDIAEVESELSVSFPDDFKQALLQHQGMSVEPCVIEFKSGAGVPFGCLFHVFSDEMAYAIKVHAKEMKENGHDNLIPISGCGNSYFGFDYRNTDENPPIVFVNGDVEPDDHRSIIPVANTFSELLSQLRVNFELARS